MNEAIKATITDGRDVIGGGDRGTLTTVDLGNDTIVGDAVNFIVSTFTGGAGADTFNINNVDLFASSIRSTDFSATNDDTLKIAI